MRRTAVSKSPRSMQPPRASDKVAEAVKGRFQTLDRLPIPVDVLSVARGDHCDRTEFSQSGVLCPRGTGSDDQLLDARQEITRHWSKSPRCRGTLRHHRHVLRCRTVRRAECMSKASSDLAHRCRTSNPSTPRRPPHASDISCMREW